MSFALLEADQFVVAETQTSHHLDIFTLVFPFGPKYPLRWIGTLVRNLFIAATTAGEGLSCCRGLGEGGIVGVYLSTSS
jgi:hypothetical protein